MERRSQVIASVPRLRDLISQTTDAGIIHLRDEIIAHRRDWLEERLRIPERSTCSSQRVNVELEIRTLEDKPGSLS